MLRRLPALLLAFLLLGLQQQVAVHVFEHLASRHDPGLEAPAGSASCATCEILASGADSVPATALPALATRVAPDFQPAAFTSRPVAFAASYRSRAPPPLS